MSNTFRQTMLKATAVPDVTPEEIILLRQIKRSVYEGHDIEIRKAPEGKLKVLEVSKKNISIG